MPQWQKPENALRRANELLEVGKKQDALDTLHDVIKARKHRQWTKIHELIMTKHLELCVELRKPHLAKDGLFQYRNMCQQVNVKSLEDVIGTFLDLAEKKADQAREESHGLVEDIEDLDQAESPEKLLLSAVSGEGAQDRADRMVLSPWLRFLWESYRQCLELLRNNVQVEVLYHKVAKQAFQFCLKYQRKAEFRKLCDNLRTHLNQIQKSQHAHYALKLSNVDTLAMHQDTRLIQLDVAIQMELWQEAFKSAEDVHQLMQLSKRQAKPSTLASYYEKLALIFWKAGNTLYHAAALMKLLQLTRELKRSVSAEESTHLATRTLLATLSVQWTGACSDLSRHLEMEETQNENQRRLAALIMMPSTPTRMSLMKDVIRFNINNVALPSAQQLYQAMEMKFDPLSLAKDIAVHLTSLSESGRVEYSQYVECLQQVAALKILKQVSQVYQTVTFKFLTKIIPFFDVSRLERLVVSAGKKAQMQVRLHHRSESVEFGVADGLSFGGEEEEASCIMAASQLNVPIVQTMPNEQIRQHLQQMFAALQDAVQTIDSDAKKNLLTQLKGQITFYNFHAADQHKRTLERKKRIEQYKEVAEKMRAEQEEVQKEQERKLNEQKVRETTQRLQQETAERTEQQKRREKEEFQRRMMQDRLDRMNDPKFKKLVEDMAEEDIEKLDNEALLQKQIAHLEQEKREQVANLKKQEKKWDYFVRAMHVEEIPMREEQYKLWAVEDRESWEQYETERIEKAITDHKHMIDSYHRLQRMEKDAEDVVKEVRAARAGTFKERLIQWEKQLRDTREKRLKERRDERKAKRREEWLQQQKENEKRKKEEEERIKREEMTKRGGDARQGYQNRPRPGEGATDKEGGGAETENWRGQGPLPPKESSYSGMARGGEDRGRGIGGDRAEPRDIDWGKREAPISGGGGFNREGGREGNAVGRDGFERRRQGDNDSDGGRPQQREEPDWGKRVGPIEAAVQREEPAPAPAPTERSWRLPDADRPPQQRYRPPMERDRENVAPPMSDRDRPPMSRDMRPPMGERGGYDRSGGYRSERPPEADYDEYAPPPPRREVEQDWSRRAAPLPPVESRGEGYGAPRGGSGYDQPRSDGYGPRGGVGGGFGRREVDAETPQRRERDREEPNWAVRMGPVEGRPTPPPVNTERDRPPATTPWRRPDRDVEGARPDYDQSQGGGRPYRPSMDRDNRGPPIDRDSRGPPMDRENRGPPMDRDSRGPPMDRERGLPMDRDNRGPPMDRDNRGPPMDRDNRGPPMDRDNRGPPMDRDNRGPPMDRDNRGPPMDRDRDYRAPPNRFDRDQRPPMDRGGYNRGSYRSDRQQGGFEGDGGPPPARRDEPDWGARRGPIEQAPPEEDGWQKVPPKNRH